MFELEEVHKGHEILDVASGVSSFCAEASLKGYDVKAADKIYSFSPPEIEKKCAKYLGIVLEKLQDVKESYKWEYFKDVDALEENRKSAYIAFISDYKEKGSSAYTDVEFPETSFEENQFTVSIVSNFLFLYDEHLDYEFHKRQFQRL